MIGAKRFTGRAAMTKMRLPIRDRESVLRSENVDSINELLFGTSLGLDENRKTSVDPVKRQVHLYLKTTSDSAVCPCCGIVSDKVHCSSFRHPQWMPINGMTTYAHIELKRFQCLNSSCSQETFVERIESVRVNQHRSDLVNLVVFAVSVFCSDIATSMICREMGIQVSHDSANRLMNHILIEDEPDVEFIGVDDVSLRKGQTYHTVIYDGNDHHLLALLDGRDGKTFSEWLKDHPKISIVARDRASAYAGAITEILPDAMQVADRFHILQNLLGYLKDIFAANIPQQILIRDGQIMDEPPEKNEELAVPLDRPDLNAIRYDNSPPIDEDGNEIKFCSMQRTHLSRNREWAKNRKNKQERVKQLRKEWQECQPCGKGAFAKAHDTTVITLNKYLNMSDEEVEDMLNIKERKKRRTDMDDYLNIVFKMMKDGYGPGFIYSYIVHSGYTGSRDSLVNHIKAIAQNNFGIKLNWHSFLKYQYPPDVVVIKRSEVLRYLTAKDKGKLKDTDVAKFYDVIRQKYYVVEICSEIWDTFYGILMGDDPEMLDPFLEKYKDSLIKPFINGIKKDIAPVKNAISSPVSSGFVEGGNCRYKATERLMFGRSGRDHLFRKAYAISIIMRSGKTSSSLIEIWLEA